VFEGIPAESYGRGRRMATDAFNKVELKISMLSAILVFNLLMAVFLMDIHKLRKLRFSRAEFGKKFQVNTKEKP
jgi:hypothetical protein